MFRKAAYFLFFLAALFISGNSRPILKSSGSRNPELTSQASQADNENQRIIHSAYSRGDYGEAHDEFLRLARRAETEGLVQHAISGWNNAGACSIATRQFLRALNELSHSRQIAEDAGDRNNEAVASNNIASLHIQMGNFDAALRIASDAVSLTPPPKAIILAGLDSQRGEALAHLDRLPEARPLFQFSISTLDDLERWNNAVIVRGIFGTQLLEAGDLSAAEPVLVEALRLARIHHIGAANVLRALGLLKAARHNREGAMNLFNAALAEPPGIAPRWLIYADRGDFLLDQNDPSDALADFQEARRLAAQMRADVVPADEDRVTLESGLGRIAAGIVNADNTLSAHAPADSRTREAFDVAEQDRQWSLRALVPAPDDWRTRLPAGYWDLLAQYQALERSPDNASTGPAAARAGALAVRLQMMEAQTGGNSDTGRVFASRVASRSALSSVQKAIPADSVLFSFYTGKRASWVWAVSKDRFDVYPVPPEPSLAASIDHFVASLRKRNPDTVSRGRELYAALFGSVDSRYLRRSRWLLELDGPLYNLPFPALVTSSAGKPAEWLIQRASVQTIPGALMLESIAARASGPFVGIADPVYNAADSRYNGRRAHVESALSRLPNTEAEVKNCAGAWACPRTEVLTGMAATPAAFEAALREQPSVIHFATHVVSGESDHGSGVIVLSLDRQGSLGLLGPRQILARPVNADLVVLDGCHSAQGAALPGTGLMGLTRAWIGAGAHAVLATLWDIPDDAQSALPAFYTSWRAHPELGPAAALRDAQLGMLASGKEADPATWAGYFLLARR